MLTREFNLQPALSHKQRLEEICQMELAEIEQSYARERRALQLLDELERLGYEELDQQHGSEKLNIAAIGVSFGDLQMLQKRLEQQLLVLQDLADRIQRKRQELIEISKAKKALEKLKEKHETRIAHAAMKAENKIMDEIATSQFYRRRLAEGAFE
ncbi:MAG: flagellar export protein FliJ [Chloroflexi bacterium]|nr:flagellar export protein FliJ [Chloroflexota bacterium]MDA8186939.1 flagellar export protein FliJ [Dehalococcoidales bacterium]